MEQRPPTILLKEAILQERMTDVHKLISGGVNIGARDNLQGRTYVMVAAEFGNHLCLQYLIECGADVHALDYAEDSALDLAVRFGRRRAVTALLPHLSMEELERTLTRTEALYGKKSEECVALVDAEVRRRKDD